MNLSLSLSLLVINEYWLLTAGHCYWVQNQTFPYPYLYNITDFYAGAGVFVYMSKLKQYYRKVKSLIQHPGYEGPDAMRKLKEKKVETKNDIALVELEKPFEFSEKTHIAPGCLFEENRSVFEDDLTVAGFGLEELAENRILQIRAKMHFTHLRQTECDPPFVGIRNSICASSNSSGVYQGDSGKAEVGQLSYSI